MIFVAQHGVGAVTATVVAHEDLGLETQRRAVRLHLVALALDWRKHRYPRRAAFPARLNIIRSSAAGLRAGAPSVAFPASCSRCGARLVLEVVRPASAEEAEDVARLHAVA